MAWFSSSSKQPPPDNRPQLELSGPKLDAAFQALVAACEGAGGVERYCSALKFKSDLFKDAFEDGKHRALTADQFAKLCAFMPTVRRRIGTYVDDDQYPAFRDRMALLFEDQSPDELLASFLIEFPDDKQHRWVKDLAAEILHNVNPERYPIMCRWVWDVSANTGVIREIWHGDIDHVTLNIDDSYETLLMLREELSQYVSNSGIFRDVIWYVDLLCAQVYAEYISAQGGSYLRADFSSADDPALHLRRLLGLDGVRAKTNRPLAPSIDGSATAVEPKDLLTGKSC